VGLRKVRGVREETAEREHGKAPGYRFAIGASKRPPTTDWHDEKSYRRLKKLQSSKPISVGMIFRGQHKSKPLWWYQDEFYVDKRSAHGEERAEGIAGLVKVEYVHERSLGGWLAGSARKYCFVITTLGYQDTTSPWLSNREYVKARRLRWSKPVSVGTIVSGQQKGKTTFTGRHRGETLWWYRDGFYVEDYLVFDRRKAGITGLTKTSGVHEDVKNRMPKYAKHYRFAVGTSDPPLVLWTRS